MISAFGLAVELALPVPELDATPAVPDAALALGPILRVEQTDHTELDAAWSGGLNPPVQARAVVDGASWIAERGQAADLRMEHPLCRFHLNPGATRLACAPSDSADPAWRRLLLDTALVTASLARGREALHAGCVVVGGAAVAIAGASGAGKTTLLLELLRAGGHFLTDDVVALEADPAGVLALPGPPLANLPACVIEPALAEPMHRLGDEWWARIRQPWTAPAPLRVMLALEPPGAPGDAPAIARLRDPAEQLLKHALHSGTDPARREQRFSLLARLAAQVEVVRVTVDRSRPARELVEQVIEAVPLLQA